MSERQPTKAPKDRTVAPSPASGMTDAAIEAELTTLGERWDESRADDEGHAGSPGEWMVERMGELEHEQMRRRKRT